MRYLLVFSFLLITHCAIAQRIISGKVTDAATNKPLVAASIFLSNTSVGTVSAADGSFNLRIPEGRYDLIISSVGYETFVKSLPAGESYPNLVFKLKEKVKELETLVLTPYEKNGWERWGKFFLENFIGTSDYAKDCVIKNYDVIRFRNSKKDNELTASAFEPLIIENNALGYRIKYQLEGFSYNFKERLIYYIGYPLFEEMEGNSRKTDRWLSRREDAYFGSTMHFMRSLFRNQLAEDGFEVRRLVRKKNEEKLRVQQLMRENRTVETLGNGRMITIVGGYQKVGDSSSYYDKVLHQPDIFNLLSQSTLAGDSIAAAFDSVTVELNFPDYLWINYKPGTVPREYKAQFPDEGTQMISQVTLINGRPIQLQSTGNYYSPTDFLNMGYWGWSEKIASILPFDYKPKHNKKAP
jgi:hypothetical protein